MVGVTCCCCFVASLDDAFLPDLPDEEERSGVMPTVLKWTLLALVVVVLLVAALLVAVGVVVVDVPASVDFGMRLCFPAFSASAPLPLPLLLVLLLSLQLSSSFLASWLPLPSRVTMRRGGVD